VVPPKTCARFPGPGVHVCNALRRAPLRWRITNCVISADGMPDLGGAWSDGEL
jgi:hypothetical protein